MRKSTLALAIAALLPNAAYPLSLQLIANYDGTLTTAYPNGDKPQVTDTCPPTGYTGLNLGGGGGTICDNGESDLNYTVIGLNSIDDMRVVYKDCGGGECQTEGNILNAYSGSTENNAAIGVGIRESTAVDSWVAQCKSLQAGVNAVQCQYGLASAPTAVNCSASGTTRPIWAAVTNYPTNSEVKGFTSSDGVTWTECFSTTRAMSNDLAYFLGGSKSATVALTARMDSFAVLTEIDAYTETPSGGGSAPTLNSAIPDQAGIEGTFFSLTFSSYFSGATSYSIVGTIPGGLSESSDGVYSGTPTASDVSSSVYSLDLCGTNTSGTTCDSVSFDFDPIAGAGAVYTIPVVADGLTTTFTCNNESTGAAGASWASILSSGSGTKPVAGDTIVLPNDTRGVMKFVACRGNPATGVRLNIYNQGGTTTIRKTTNDGIALEFDNSWYFNFGAAGATCGVDETTGNLDSTCPVVVTSNAAGHPQDYIGFTGFNHNYTLANIEVAGVGQCGTGGGGHALGINDHNKKWTDQSELRENIKITHLYVHDTGRCGQSTGEGMYLGTNSKQNEVPLKNIEVSYNWLQNIGGGGIKIKNALFGVNKVHHNRLKNIGGSGGVPQIDGLNGKNVVNLEVYSNRVETVLGSCYDYAGETLQSGWQGGANPSGGYTKFWNNMASDCGTGGSNFGGDGISFSNASMNFDGNVEIDFNTVVDVLARGVQSGEAATTGDYNIVLATGGAALSGVAGTGNVTTGVVADQNFVDGVGPAYDLHLTGSSPGTIKDAGPTTCAAVSPDIDDDVRPNGSKCDKGADEYVP